ncbi:hypothetical protein [Umezawaea beigongshangensis]|uniref:hypothetical protein n=1 Tax=Umezawaea beigongshangensis TaxID=2780383 RepID=UPI0018F123B4|nr:hypothetical protein [Umezawaea beigongshangensis]
MGTCRAAESARDGSAVIGGEVSPDTVFDVVASEGDFTVRPTGLDPPVRKVFPDDESGVDETPETARRFVALDTSLYRATESEGGHGAVHEPRPRPIR